MPMPLPVEAAMIPARSEEHTSELQLHHDLVCRLLLEKKNVVAPEEKIRLSAASIGLRLNNVAFMGLSENTALLIDIERSGVFPLLEEANHRSVPEQKS